jgi:hypothetical protein
VVGGLAALAGGNRSLKNVIIALIDVLNVENMMQIRLGGETITGTPERDLGHTSPEGKASSVLLVHFRFTPAQISRFRAPAAEVIAAVAHPNYAHMAVMPESVKSQLVKDFA